MSKLIGSLILSCFLLNRVELSKLNEHLTREDVESFNFLMSNITSNMTKLNTSNDLQLDSEPTNVLIKTTMMTHFEKHCRSNSNSTVTTSVPGTITDNRITYRESIGNEFTGLVTISPDPNLQGFNVDFGLSEYSNGIEMHFNDNHMKCKTNEGFKDVLNIKGEICVQTYNLKRASGGTVKGCFIIGGALLTSKYYDINTINSYNALSAAVVDLGCYAATTSDIKQYFINETDPRLSIALGAIVTPIHDSLCNSAVRTSPLLIPVFVLILKSLILTN